MSRRCVATSPRRLFADVDRLVILADVLSALHAGPVAFADTSAALQSAAASLRWEWSWLEAFAALRDLRLPPRLISRVAFAATKADHVADRQRGNLLALMRSLTKGAFDLGEDRVFCDCLGALHGGFRLDAGRQAGLRGCGGRVLGQRSLTRFLPWRSAGPCA